MWILLALALWLLQFSKKAAAGLLLVTVITGAVSGVLDWRAWLFLTALLLVAIARMRFGDKKVVVHTTEVLVLAFACGLMIHWIPGFHNVKVIDHASAGPESAPFSMYYNFDKALLPFVLLIAMRSLFVSVTAYKPAKWQWLLLVAAVPALLLVAVLLGGLKPESHAPAWLLQFVFANIFFVSLAEEALFRGYLQQRLSGFMHPVLALFIAALIFGAMHLAGGMMLVVFATLAGVIYGLAWMWSGRLWVAVLFHAGLNIAHLLFFTYPAAVHG
ncbi:CPBP family intramembrane glutamic endopeptidase [Pantoea cypripedii]|uniref:CAAX protease family protein n=1 Tax=Pantoea cypripedii TaxID=55209 RepID=A0A1X1EK42_PANCY|nr:CPBP family intramembrane glutamic endopeptidase [Pantoea cypripedii]MBP2200360.1 membrane protease YdiL (CAAX protease family) [Pantoea cypripedii]ORM89114.1 CAAX protease family protein [Pantoea cypripedii]